MSPQLALFGDSPSPTKTSSRDQLTIEQRFESFHVAHPHVFDTLRKLALEHIACGATRVGVKWLWEQARIRLEVERTGAFKLDNTLTALYARKLIEVEPSLAQFIELRERRAK